VSESRGTSRISSTPADWTGSTVRGLENVHKKFLIQAACMQPRAPAAINVWLRQAKSCSRPSCRGHFDDFGCHKNRSRPLLVGVGALFDHTTSVFANHKAAGWFHRQPKIGRFRHGLLRGSIRTTTSRTASSPRRWCTATWCTHPRA
jgi:hypothetical protein